MNKYPIYNVSATWSEIDCEHNGTSFSFGLKNKKERYDPLKWWGKYSEKNKDKKFILKSLEVKKLGDYSWWSGWFSHMTYNKFDSFEDAKNDFERFLREELNANFGSYSNEESYIYEINNQNICFENGDKIGSLMGAEQIWRWRECDCEACKKGENKVPTIIVH